MNSKDIQPAGVTSQGFLKVIRPNRQDAKLKSKTPRFYKKLGVLGQTWRRGDKKHRL